MEAFGLALTLVLLITPLVIRSAAALRLYDSPDDDRRVHLAPIPRLGGVAVFLGAAGVASILFARASGHFVNPGSAGATQIQILAGAFIGSALLFLTGLVDDIRGLSPGVKFIAQLLAAGIAVAMGLRLDSVALGYGMGISLGWIGVPLLMLWIVGVTNVFNFIDGLNGLAGGIAIVACATIIVAGAVLGNLAVLLPTIALMGALFGFLRYNYPKAEIFLGDSGSLSVGYLLAVLSLMASVNNAGATLVIIPLVTMAVPLLDGILAIARRWLRHVPLSGADARHIHHRLLALGLTPERTARTLWLLAIGLAGFGLLISLTAPFVATSIAIFGVVGVAVVLIYGTNLLSYHELMVAGEVLLTAPSRARRVISDQILALDISSMLDRAETIEEVSTILSESAGQFGFLAVELSGESPDHKPLRPNTLVLKGWAWKLDYPIRLNEETVSPHYILSIWCSPEFSTRPYGAERVARIIGPALRQWFEKKDPEAVTGSPRSKAKRKSLLQRARASSAE